MRSRRSDAGYMLLYSENVKKLKDQRQSEEKTLAETERARENAERERDEKEREIQGN